METNNETRTDEAFKYFAFISYSSHDFKWGKRLQKKLEGYILPITLCSEHGWKRKPMRPIFFAPTDIQPGGLNEELENRLKASKNLVVICSPYSARSKWVGREIEFFYELGRKDNIFFFIIDGIPHSGDPETECFNPVVEKMNIPEILGANIHEKIYRWPWLNRERASVQLVTKLLGIEFDAIWQRHKRRLIQTATAWVVGTAAVVAAVTGAWMYNRPVDVNIGLKEATVHNSMLPPLKDAVMTLSLDNEIKTDTLAAMDDKGLFTNVPRRFIGKEVQLTVDCHDFVKVDTTVVLQENMKVDIRRDASVYGNVNFRLWNPNTETVVAGCDVEIEGMKSTTDAEGRVKFEVPLASQRPSYSVSAAVPLEDSVVYMPSGKDDVILVK